MTTMATEEPPAPAVTSAPTLTGTERIRDLTLAALPNAVNLARLFIRHTLDDRPDTPRVEHASRELVMHAVATTGVSSPAPLYDDVFERLQLIAVRLRWTPERAVVEVWERTEQPPQPRLRDSPALADVDWGYAVPLPGRRVVWCAIASELSALPRRTRRPERSAGASSAPVPETDPAVLRRVLDSLRELGPSGAPQRTTDWQT